MLDVLFRRGTARERDGHLRGKATCFKFNSVFNHQTAQFPHGIGTHSISNLTFFGRIQHIIDACSLATFTFGLGFSRSTRYPSQLGSLGKVLDHAPMEDFNSQPSMQYNVVTLTINHLERADVAI